MSQGRNPNYFMGPHPQMTSQRYHQQGRPLSSQPVLESFYPVYQGAERTLPESHDIFPNIKYEYGSPPGYSSPPGDQSDSQKSSVSRVPKVTTEQIELLLSQNYDLIKEINDSNVMEDPRYIPNLTKLHQNLLFLARISDQPN